MNNPTNSEGHSETHNHSRYFGTIQASPTRKPRRTYTLKELEVNRVAKEAAALIAQHQGQFANLAVPARTIQMYLPTGKKHQSDYALLASALVDSAECRTSMYVIQYAFFEPFLILVRYREVIVSTEDFELTTAKRSRVCAGR